MNDTGILDLPELVMLVLFIVIEIFCVQSLIRMSIGGFSTQIEKTALTTKGEIKPSIVKLTKDDAILMLAVADKYEPKPTKIQYNIKNENGPIINIDESFLADRSNSLLQANNELSTIDTIKLKLYIGEKGLRKWVVTP